MLDVGWNTPFLSVLNDKAAQTENMHICYLQEFLNFKYKIKNNSVFHQGYAALLIL